MKRISPNQDIFEAKPGETIRVSIVAVATPFDVTFDSLNSGGTWTHLQEPSPDHPTETRQFTMPSGSESFTISFAFPPADQVEDGAKYNIIFSGGGSTDGPNDVLPPFAGDTDELTYDFNLPS